MEDPESPDQSLKPMAFRPLWKPPMTFVKESRHALVHPGDLDCRLDISSSVLEARVRLFLLLNTTVRLARVVPEMVLSVVRRFPGA